MDEKPTNKEQAIANAISALSFLMIDAEISKNTKVVAKINRFKLFIDSL